MIHLFVHTVLSVIILISFIQQNKKRGYFVEYLQPASDLFDDGCFRLIVFMLNSK